MNRFATLIAAACIAVSTLAAAQPLAASQPLAVVPPLAPVRSQRSWMISATGEGLLLFAEGAMSAFPLAGVQLSYNLHPNVALDLSYRTLGFYNVVDAGARYFFLKHAVSPYVYLRSGVMIAGMEHEFDTKAMANLSSGVGFELSTRSGFNFFSDGGADCYAAPGISCAARLSVGFGYRF